MRYLARLPLLLLAALSSLAACPSSVEHQDAGGDATTGTGGGASSSSGTSGCAGPTPQCAPGCGGDFFDSAECVGGAWTCPPGEVMIDDCPPGSCFGIPLPCETCPDGWACEPDAMCVGSCGGIVCAECPAEPGPAIFGACECSCDEAGQYTCTLAAGCCTTDQDCGDGVYVPCVANVCKEPVPGGCWADAECPPGQTCQGASVCPCGALCDAPDTPGTCM